MKKRILNVFTILAIAIAVVGCKKAKEASTSEAEAAAVSEITTQKYVTDVTKSSIEWKGFKPTGSHNGSINIDTGVFQVDNGTIQSGTFLIDMNSITVLDIPAEDEGNGKLLGHLKSPDFFDVENNSDSAFEITGVSEADGKTMLAGNLSIKGIKNNITFPVNITAEGEALTISSEAFTIDRTLWNIKYKSKSVFGDLGDKFINDEMELKINVVAFKKA